MIQELEKLLEMQKQDLELREQSAKIAGLHKRRESFVQAIKREHAEFDEQKNRFEELQRKSRERSGEVDDLDAQIRNDQEKLRTGLLSYKEMDALRVRVEHSRSRMDQLEDEAIALINRVEDETPDIRAVEEAFVKWKDKIDQEIAQIDQEIAAHHREIEQLRAFRAERAVAVESSLLKRYEELHRKYEDPIALVQNGSCSGCKLRVSEIAVERVREGQGLVACEHCSRLLYIK